MIHRPIYHLGPEKNQNCRRVLFFADKENKQQQTQRSADNRNLILCRCKVVLIRSSPISPPHRQPQNMLLAATGHLVTTNIIEKNNSAQHMFYEHSLQTSVFANFFLFFACKRSATFRAFVFAEWTPHNVSKFPSVSQNHCADMQTSLSHLPCCLIGNSQAP